LWVPHSSVREGADFDFCNFYFGFLGGVFSRRPASLSAVFHAIAAALERVFAAIVGSVAGVAAPAVVSGLHPHV
jgi:hypothetical protein